jgi:hypothetical protein
MAIENKFAEIQPTTGDHYVHCGHSGTAPEVHFWRTPGTLFVRPDGTTGEAKWMICSDACIRQANADPERVHIRGDGTWVGDEAICVKAEPPRPTRRFDSWRGECN